MKPENAYNLKLVSSMASGKHDLVGLTWIEEWDYAGSIFMISGKQLRRITWGKNDRSPYWAGEEVLFLRRNGNADSLMALNPYEEVREIFRFNSIKKFIPYGEGFLFLGEEASEADLPFIADSGRKYKFDGRGLLRRRTSLYYWRGGRMRHVFGGDNFDVTDVATNGKRIVAIASTEDDDRGISSIVEVDLESGIVREKDRGLVASSVAITENGEYVIMGHREGIKPWAISRLIWEDGETSLCGNTCGGKVLTDLFDGVKEEICVSGDTVYTLGTLGGSVLLYRVRKGSEPYPLTKEGNVVRTYSCGGTLYSYTSPSKPSVISSQNETIDLNPEVNGEVPKRIQAGRVEGWVLGNGGPTVLFVHGGPHTAYGYAYYIEFQFLYSNGFTILYGNPRGSQGYGEDFAGSIVGDWGPGVLKDLFDLISSAEKETGSKMEPIGITGGSYGGYFTNWAVTQTERFKCAIAERSISNLVSMCGTSDIGFWFNAVEAGVEDPWSREGMQRLMEMSPIYHVKNVKTPLMLIHGELDLRCPIEQAEQMYVALKSLGREATLVRYQGDSHEHARRGKPKNMEHRLRTKLDFFRKYLMDNSAK